MDETQEKLHKRIHELLVYGGSCNCSLKGEWCDVYSKCEVGVDGETFSLKKGDSIIIKPPKIMLLIKSEGSKTREVEFPMARLTKIATPRKGTVFF
jgi:hypothetical protein